MNREKLIEYLKLKPKGDIAGPMDCYALVQKVATDAFGIKFPSFDEIVETYNKEQSFNNLIIEHTPADSLVTIKEEDVREGDFVNISNYNDGNITHVGIMVSKDEYIHMGKYGAQIRKLRDIKYRNRICNFRRWVKDGKYE